MPRYTSPTSAVDAFAIALRTEMIQTLSRRKTAFDYAEDIANTEVARFLSNPQPIMANYVDAGRYARVRASHATADQFRTERVQRCEGARLNKGPNDSWTKSNTTISGDAPLTEDGELTLLDTWTNAGPEFDSSLTDQLVALEQLAPLLAELAPDQVEIIWRVHVLDQTIVAAAAHMGIARETANRKHSSTIRQLRAAAVDQHLCVAA